MADTNVRIRGGRLVSDSATSRGQDVGVFVVDSTGHEHFVKGVRSIVIRCNGRRSFVTCEIEVDDVDLTCAWLDTIDSPSAGDD